MRGVFVAATAGGFARYGFDAMGRAYRHRELYADEAGALAAVDPVDAGAAWEPVSPADVEQAATPRDSLQAHLVRDVFESARSRLAEALVDPQVNAELTRRMVVPAVVAVLKQPGVSPLSAAWAVGHLTDAEIAHDVHAAFVTAGTDAELTAAGVNILRVAPSDTVSWLASWRAATSPLIADRPLDADSVEDLVEIEPSAVRPLRRATTATPADVSAESSRLALNELALELGQPVVDMGRAWAVEAVAAARVAQPAGPWRDRLNLAFECTRTVEPPLHGQLPVPAVRTCAGAAVAAVAWEDLSMPAEVGVPSTHMAIALVSEYVLANGTDPAADGARDPLRTAVALRTLRADAGPHPAPHSPPTSPAASLGAPLGATPSAPGVEL